ncbi:MAG: dTDP-4-dehydrorhamnose reductase [Pseudomonadota bacterium]
MKAVVTGANGQLGKALLATCPPHVEAVGLTRMELDLVNTPLIADVIASQAPDLIINAAAYTAVDKAESEAELAHQINGVAVKALQKAAAEHTAKLVHVSTDFVFDGRKSSPYLPGDATNPQSVYGASKLAGEHAVDGDTLLVRTSWVYGAAGSNFVNTMLRLMASKPALSVVTDQIGTPTYARGLASALWQMAEKGASGIYHYSDSGAASWYDFAVAIQEEAVALGVLSGDIPISPIATSEYPTPAARPAYSVLDKAKTWQLLGAPAPHWRSQLRETLRTLKSHG